MSENPQHPESVHEPLRSAMSVGEHNELFLTGALDPPKQPGMFGALDRFEIIRQIGAGGMGIVFECRDPQDGGRVAIKLLRPELANIALATHRFLVEARHMQQLVHPHIVPVLAVQERERGPFYVMPFMTGGSLAAKLGRPLEDATLVRIATEVADALVYAHMKGILHRDIKPANILLDETGRSYVCDFGLVRTFFNDSKHGSVEVRYEGTAAYMSPNVAAGLKEDTRCDIYSFGATLYEMLTGHPPYEGRSSEYVAKKVVAGPPEPIRSRSPKAPAGLVKVAEGCMARELRDRYAEMADVLADLRCAALGQSIRGPHGRGSRTMRKAAMIAAGLLALGILGLATWRLDRHQVPAVAWNNPSPSEHRPLSQPTSAPVTPATHPANADAQRFLARLEKFNPATTQIQIDDIPATDAGLAALERFHSLTSVRLKGRGITDAGLAHLKPLRRLHVLTLTGASIHGHGFDALTDLPDLQIVRLAGCPVDDGGIGHVQGAKAIRELEFCDAAITDAGLVALGQLTHLTRLDLWGDHITDAGVARLEGLTELRGLGLRGTRVSAGCLRSLHRMSHLVWLELRAVPLHPTGSAQADHDSFAALASLPQLGHLDLCSTPVRDEDLAYVAMLPRLRELNLDQTQLTDAAMESIAQCGSLETLSVCDTKITDDGMRRIARLPNLKTLYLDRTSITDAGVALLNQMPQLSVVHLSCPRVSAAAMADLQRSHPQLAVRR